MTLLTLGPHVTSTSSNHFTLLGQWSTSGSDRGIAHFFTATRNAIEGVREKRTNEQYACVNSSAEGKLCNTAFPVFICRLTLAWILAKILQRYEECQPILTGLPHCGWTVSHADLSLCCLMSTGHFRHPSPTASSSSFVELSDRRSLLTSGHPRSPVQNPLSGFAPKQTKESSAWRTT